MFRLNLPLGNKNKNSVTLKDYGPDPFVVNIDAATIQNDAFRTVLWTGENLQLTLMSINANEEIGLEMHPNIDQFLRVEQGEGMVRMGNQKSNLTYERSISDGTAILVPAGTWHNIINTGKKPIKLYSIYAPPKHPKGTIHKTKAEATSVKD